MVVTEERIAGIPSRWITPANAQPRRTILYLHGGGWVYGLLPFYNVFIGWIAQAAQARALAIDYRLAPEYPFPAAVEDCLAAYRFLLEQGVALEDLIILGDSAGGNLALATMLAARQAELPLPAGAVLMSPATDLAGRGASYEKNGGKDALLPASFVKFAKEAYLAGHDPRDPLISPVYGDLRGLPPLLIQAGGDEILLSDAQKIAELASQAGVDVTLRVYPGMWHVWQIFGPYLPEARQALAELNHFIRQRV
jgi:acetyl esterase/lipase